jgi:transglutaminase-like putative cysteine protease
MLLDIHHQTVYRYDTAANYSLQTMRLWPRSDGGQRVRHWQIDAPGRRWVQQDAYGNTVHMTSLVEKHHDISVVARGQVETLDERGVLIAHESKVPPLAFALPTPLTQSDAAIEALAQHVLGSQQNPAQITQAELAALCDAVFESITYVQGVTDVTVTAPEALKLGQGVCQDMTHLFLALCRARGVAARYVSGYLLTDATHAASHAWAEAWVPQAQAWLGFDVTHKRLAGPELCRLAVGRDYADASPMRGMHMGGTGETMTVKVAVQDSLQMVLDQ